MHTILCIKMRACFPFYVQKIKYLCNLKNTFLLTLFIIIFKFKKFPILSHPLTPIWINNMDVINKREKEDILNLNLCIRLTFPCNLYIILIRANWPQNSNFLTQHLEHKIIEKPFPGSTSRNMNSKKQKQSCFPASPNEKDQMWPYCWHKAFKMRQWFHQLSR